MTTTKAQTQDDEAARPPEEGGSIATGPDPREQVVAFLQKLLEAQCALVEGVAGAVFLGVGGETPVPPAAIFRAPAINRITDGADPLTPAILARLERLAAETVAEPGAHGRGDTIALSRGNRAMYGDEVRLRALATPLAADGRIEGATVILAAPRQGYSEPDALRTLVLAAGRFEAFLWKQQCLTEAEQKLMLRQTVELLDASQQGGTAAGMGAILCHELKRRFGATRVSIGLVKGDFLRLVAVSGADSIDRNAPAVEALEAAMEEAASQDCEIIFPAPADAEADPAQRRVRRAHEELSRRFGPAALLSLPLRVEGDLVGVAILEREADAPFPFGAVALLRLVAETVGPALWTRRLADRGVYEVVRDRARELAVQAVGPRHTGAKLVVALVLAALLGAAILPVPSRISSPAEVKAAAARTIVPPYSGYLAAVKVKPGDEVKAGDVLAEMDTAEMRLQLVQAESEQASQLTQHAAALSKGELAKAKQYEYDAAKSKAVADMARENLAHAVIRSPIDGVVGKGDLEQYVRAKVDPTQPLFEVVTDKKVCVAFVGERDILRVKQGQTGRFVGKALPGEKMPMTVARITPVAEARDGAQTYEVELTPAVADGDAALRTLRPGMTGTAKLDDGWTTPLATLLRPVVDEVRMRWWW